MEEIVEDGDICVIYAEGREVRMNRKRYMHRTIGDVVEEIVDDGDIRVLYAEGQEVRINRKKVFL